MEELGSVTYGKKAFTGGFIVRIIFKRRVRNH